MPVNKDTVMLPVHKDTRTGVKKLAKLEAKQLNLPHLTTGQYLQRLVARELERVSSHE